jgi:hypothetical protein
LDSAFLNVFALVPMRTTLRSVWHRLPVDSPRGKGLAPSLDWRRLKRGDRM